MAASEPPTLWVAITIAAASLAVCAPLMTHGPLPLGSDVYSTTHYLQSFMKAFSEGDIYPRWTDGTNQGLGAPSFVLLTPLTYYLAAGAVWLSGSIITGFKLYLLAVTALAGVSFYALARQWIGPGLPSAIASAVYLLLPYHVLDMYQRFALSETTAFIFLPLILLFARRTILVGGPADFVGLSLSYAGLIYTHIVSSLLFTLLFGLWLMWETKLRWRALLRPSLALACGLALAAPALLPAVMEKSASNVAWLREMPNGDYRINFIFKDDVLPGLGIKDPVKPPVLKSAHSQLVLAAVATGLALAWTGRHQHRRRLDVIAAASGCALAYFLQLEVSTPVWSLVPELPNIQFPWRFQTIMVLTASLLSGFALSAGWGRAAGKGRRGLIEPGAVLLGLIVIGNLGLAWQNASLKSFQFDEAASQQTFVVNWIEPAFTPVQFEAFRAFKQTPISIPQVSFAAGTGDVSVMRWASSSRLLKVDSAGGGTVAVRSFWFPGWTATLDGQPLDLRPSPRAGVATFTVPAGSHEVAMRFSATPVRRAASLIAAGAVIATAMLSWWSSRLPGVAMALQAG